MNLSKNFTLDELTRSQTAARHGINNTPNAAQVENLRALCVNVLQPVRDLVGRPVIVSSGYRCRALNRKVGGARNSQHQTARAADFTAQGLTVDQLFDLIVKSNIPFDQIIHEFGEWVHISFAPNPRRQVLFARRDKNGKVIYSKK